MGDAEQSHRPVVDVVILTWNDGSLLDIAVDSALSSLDVDVRVYVIDNGSDTPVVCRRDPRVTLLHNEINRGVACARNQGVRAGDAPVVCFLDSDARLHPGALATLVEALLADDRHGLTAPVFSHQRPEDSAGARPTMARKLLRAANLTGSYAGVVRGSTQVQQSDRGRTQKVAVAIGACQVFRRDAFVQVGGLDEAYFYGPEDIDFCLRLGAVGWNVLQVLDARVDHPARRRNRRLLTRSGLRHAVAVARFLWRHRFGRPVFAPRTGARAPADAPRTTPSDRSAPDGNSGGSSDSGRYPAVDVVIVGYRSGQRLLRAIESVSAEPSVGRVIVVDHGNGADATLAKVVGAVTVHDPTNPGFGAGQNAGRSFVTTPYVLVLNPDAEMRPGVIAEALVLLEARPEVGAVQGVIIGRDGRPERSQGRAIGSLHLIGRAIGAGWFLRNATARSLVERIGVGRIPSLADHVERVPRDTEDVEALAATAILFRVAALESVGGFDERYFLYGEDLDLARRLRGLGWRLTSIPAVWADHASGASSETTWDRELEWWRGTLRYFARWSTDAEWRRIGFARTVVAGRLVLRRPRSAPAVREALTLSPRAVRAARTITPVWTRRASRAHPGDPAARQIERAAPSIGASSLPASVAAAPR